MCNKIRMEAQEVSNTGFPLEVFPEKMKQLLLGYNRPNKHLKPITESKQWDDGSEKQGNKYSQTDSKNAIIDRIVLLSIKILSKVRYKLSDVERLQKEETYG